MWTNHAKALGILGGLSALLIGIGWMVSPVYAAVLGVAALALSAALYFRSARLVLWLHGARPLRERDAAAMHAIADGLSRRAGLSKPRLFRIPDPGVNAFSLGRNGREATIVLTDGFLATLNPREIRAVLAHELAHIKQGDTVVGTIAAGIASGLGFAVHTMLFSFVIPTHPEDKDPPRLSPLVTKLMAPLLWPFVRAAASSRRDLDADIYALTLTGDAEAMQGALARMHLASFKSPSRIKPTCAFLCTVNPLTDTGLATWLSRHGSMHHRLERLRGAAPASVRMPSPRRVPIFRACDAGS